MIFNKSEARDFIRHLPGFVLASFLLSRTSDRIVEYVQWRSLEDLIAATGDERVREHVQVVEQNGAADFGLYDVCAVVPPVDTASVVGP